MPTHAQLNLNQTFTGINTFLGTVIANSNLVAGGYVRIGSTTAPANTTAGDTTGVRLAIGDNTAFSSATGYAFKLSYTATDTASAGIVIHNARCVINPATNSSTTFKVFQLQGLITSGIVGTLNEVRAMQVENRYQGTANVNTTRLVGLDVAGLNLTNANLSATISNVIGLRVQPYGTPSTTVTGGGSLTTATGIALLNGDAGIAPTTLIGIDIPALTRGATNIGLRVALPSGGATANYALQLSDTGGTASGGITFGTDTNLYRSGANVLTTDDTFSAVAYKVGTSAGVDGSFTTADSKTVTVTKGIITAIV